MSKHRWYKTKTTPPPAPGWYPASRLHRHVKTLLGGASDARDLNVLSKPYRNLDHVRWWSGHDWSVIVDIFPHVVSLGSEDWHYRVLGLVVKTVDCGQNDIAWTEPWWVLTPGEEPSDHLLNHYHRFGRLPLTVKIAGNTLVPRF